MKSWDVASDADGVDRGAGKLTCSSRSLAKVPAGSHEIHGSGAGEAPTTLELDTREGPTTTRWVGSEIAR